jgi:hypothetical protein
MSPKILAAAILVSVFPVAGALAQSAPNAQRARDIYKELILASANVNCRILPGVGIDAVKQTIVDTLADPKITVSLVREAHPSQPAILREDVMAAVESLTKEMFPGVVVVPVMSTGATDGLYFRNAGIPTFGVDGTFGDGAGTVRARACAG